MKLTSIQSLAGSALLALALAVTAKAAPLPPIEGNIDFSGSASLASGTIPGQNVSAIDIASGAVTVQGATETEDYTAIANGTAATFASPIQVSSPSLPISPLWTVVYGGVTYTFVATTEVVTYDEVGSPSLIVAGAGYATATGFSNESGTWDIDVTGSAATVSFQSNALVPDKGTTALLILLGAAGIAIGAFASRRKTVKA